MTGSLFVNKKTIDPSLTGLPQIVGKCCNTGDGPDCKPETGEGKTITYQNEEYGLLRSSAKFIEGNIHLEDSLDRVGNDPIIINASDKDNNINDLTTKEYNQYCRTNSTQDTYFKKAPTTEDAALLAKNFVPIDQLRYLLQTYCTAVPNDALIFVCRENCQASACPPASAAANAKCYGDQNSLYDVYYKLSDFNQSGIPDFIANCNNKLYSHDIPQLNSANALTLNSEQRLQLDTFKPEIATKEASVPWVSPFCKPAVYLYPEKTMSINVKVKPVGPMTYTIPQYPDGGWTVRAEPNGDIFYQNKRFDYLYYEAEIPDSEIVEPQEGYVVKYSELENLFNEILPKLGLNKKESTQFEEYWLDVLPKAPYYSVKIIPESNLDHIAPLTFSVKPDSIKRVTLSFAPLDKQIELPKPTILPFKRTGFTVIEWGGLFKRNKNYNFSCFM